MVPRKGVRRHAANRTHTERLETCQEGGKMPIPEGNTDALPQSTFRLEFNLFAI